MIAPSHTPGPWKLIKRDTTFDIVGADGIEVLKTSWHSSTRERYPLKDESLENARLATAAPELLEALILALPYVESCEDDPAYKPMAVKLRVKMIRTAIAKADPASLQSLQTKEEA